MRIKIHPHDKDFAKLMRQATQGIRTKNLKLIEQAKKEFGKANIQLFYNKETDVLRVLEKDCPPIDFPISQWSSLPKQK